MLLVAFVVALVAQPSDGSFDVELRCVSRFETGDGRSIESREIVRYFGLSLQNEQATIVQIDPRLIVHSASLTAGEHFVTVRYIKPEGPLSPLITDQYTINRQDLTMSVESRFMNHRFAGRGRCERMRGSNAF